jgi:hypothetical protein
LTKDRDPEWFYKKAGFVAAISAWGSALKFVHDVSCHNIETQFVLTFLLTMGGLLTPLVWVIYRFDDAAHENRLARNILIGLCFLIVMLVLFSILFLMGSTCPEPS